MIRLLNTDEARLAVWQAIKAITIGNATDDKLIVANLAKTGVYLATAATPTHPTLSEDKADWILSRACCSGSHPNESATEIRGVTWVRETAALAAIRAALAQVKAS